MAKNWASEIRHAICAVNECVYRSRLATVFLWSRFVVAIESCSSDSVDMYF